MSEIAVKEFAGYNEFDNNHIYDLVVSLRILQTATGVRTPIDLVVAGIRLMLERPLATGGLKVLGHPSAAAFEVHVDYVGGLIDTTREEMADKHADEIATTIKGFQIAIDRLMAENTGLLLENAGLLEIEQGLRDDNADWMDKNTLLQSDIAKLMAAIPTK